MSRSASSSVLSLSQVEPLLEREPVKALEVLLAVYQQTFEPRVAQLIERHGATLGQPVEGLSLKQFERSEALRALAERVPVSQRTRWLEAFALFAGSAQGQNVWPALEPWALVDADPRLAHAALKLLVTPRAVRSMTEKLFRRLASCVERHGHRDLVSQLRAHAPASYDPRRISNIAQRLEKRVASRPVEGAVLERLERLVVAPLVPSLPHSEGIPESALVAAIIAAPDDDAPRLMYADWLTERQLPYGEFISLQVNRAHGRVAPEARFKEAELLQHHRVQFLGPFAGRVNLSGCRFERGMLVRCTQCAELPRHPLVRLLEDLEFNGDKVPHELSFDSLRTARNLSIEVLPELMERAPRLQSAATRLYLRGRVAELTVTRELLKRLPRPLRHLEFGLTRTIEPVAFILKETFAIAQLGQLESLKLRVASPLDVPREALERLPSSLRRLAIEFRRPWLTLLLMRTEAGWLKAEVSNLGYEEVSGLGELLVKLGVSQLTVKGVQQYRHERVAAQLAQFPSLNAELA
jgi:uncharacterized protein (TIGR02996 family)